MTSRHVCFTINNPTLTPEDVAERLEKNERVRYAIFQSETGESGTPHYQGYVEYDKPQRYSFLHRLLEPCHCERRKGTRTQARDYCRKEDSRVSGPWEVGTFNGGGQGSRTDLSAIAQSCMSGSLKRVAEDHPEAILRYPRGVMLLTSLHAGTRTDKPTVHLLVGKPGCGKTRWAVDTFGNFGEAHYRKAPDTHWFDGYDGQLVLTFDDFMGAASKISVAKLLQLLDRYPIDVEIKGGFRPLLATTIIITSNYHPDEWYNWYNRDQSYQALMRRIDHVYTFNNANVMKEEESVDLYFNPTGAVAQ